MNKKELFVRSKEKEFGLDLKSTPELHRLVIRFLNMYVLDKTELALFDELAYHKIAGEDITLYNLRNNISEKVMKGEMEGLWDEYNPPKNIDTYGDKFRDMVYALQYDELWLKFLYDFNEIEEPFWMFLIRNERMSVFKKMFISLMSDENVEGDKGAIRTKFKKRIKTIETAEEWLKSQNLFEKEYYFVYKGEDRRYHDGKGTYKEDFEEFWRMIDEHPFYDV